jgi:hypothetical protein
MRVNEYNTLSEFTNEYIGEWSPAEDHWFGLDFLYKGKEYRLHTGSMYNPECTILPNGKEALFGVYVLDEKIPRANHCYTLIGEYADMNSLLNDCIIEGRNFGEVIMDDSTKILGKD